MHLTTYLALLRSAEYALAESHRMVGAGHPVDADVYYTTHDFAHQCDQHAEALNPVVHRYTAYAEPEPDRLHPPAMAVPRTGPVGLLRDLQDLEQLAHLVESTWSITSQAAQGARDHELIALATHGHRETGAQLGWLRMRVKATAAQTLLAAP